MKKGRHRRYEEARKFQRATAERFTIEDYDFDNSDRFGVDPGDRDLIDEESAPDDQYGHLADKYDDYSDLEAKYADFDSDADAESDANTGAAQRESA
ncbi:hypothetical protein [Candidatus Poriferisodalis sp.]|uniref:hypothetical protein n=1 Tax=Candidatus Poriferisodalis sp. TaxID=3101277 RepID=UPI003B028678